MSFFSQSKKILGMNARNLKYITPYNSREHKKFTTNKIYTKNFLESRGISVAKTYHTISNHRQLTNELFKSLPQEFVIKPNKGFGGGGILVILEKKGKSWITASDEKFDQDQLYQHCISILDGKYSLSGYNDSIIIEELLEKHNSLRDFTEIGLPDVRVIVFNRVPIMAMMRVPTHESGGKANMELGAIGVGIDIGTGITTRGAKYSKIVSKMHNGFPIKGFKIPLWEEILLTSSRIQHFTGVGYLGIDFVLTKNGLRVLELNSLAGLKIQIANKAPLLSRLEKIQDLSIKTPEEGVEIAKKLFSQNTSIEKPSSDKPIIGAIESVILNNDKPQTILAHIDLFAKENTIHQDLISGKILDITIKNKRLKLPVTIKENQEKPLILAGKYLSDFYINPTKKIIVESNERVSSQVDEKMLKNIDEKIANVDSKIKLLSFINPQNLEEQKNLFLHNPEFSPRFIYRTQELDFEQMRRDLRKLPEVDHFLYPLFSKKIEEIEQKITLIQSVGSNSFQDASENIFGSVGVNSYQSALLYLEKYDSNKQEDPSPLLDLKSTQEIIREFLNQYKLKHWQIKIINETVADIQVTKKHSILLKKNASFNKNRLEALLVHEIGTHVFRYENGKRQPYRIFERGTAGYLKTEEGLAIWNQNQLNLELGLKTFIPALHVITAYYGQKMSFLDLFHFLKKEYQLSDESTWRFCLKNKRGLSNTSQLQVFTKDALYFRGLREIERFVKEGGKINDLYAGKITPKDLLILKKIEGIKKPKFLL